MKKNAPPAAAGAGGGQGDAFLALFAAEGCRLGPAAVPPLLLSSGRGELQTPAAGGRARSQGASVHAGSCSPAPLRLRAALHPTPPFPPFLLSTSPSPPGVPLPSRGAARPPASRRSCPVPIGPAGRRVRGDPEAAARGGFLGYATGKRRAGPFRLCVGAGSRGRRAGRGGQRARWAGAGPSGSGQAAAAMSGAAGCQGGGGGGERGHRWRRPWKLLALGLLSASSVLAAAPGAGAMSKEEKRRLG